MFLMIALGLVTTLVGVALGGTVLELTLRAVGYSLTEHPVKAFVEPRAGSRWQTGLES